MVSFVICLLLRAHSAVLTGRATGFGTSTKTLCNAAVFVLKYPKWQKIKKKLDSVKVK
jgi:hypothetical protein